MIAQLCMSTWGPQNTRGPLIVLLIQASHGGDAYIPLYWDLLAARDVFYARYIDWFVTVRSACHAPGAFNSLLQRPGQGPSAAPFLPAPLDAPTWGRPVITQPLFAALLPAVLLPGTDSPVAAGRAPVGLCACWHGPVGHVC